MSQKPVPRLDSLPPTFPSTVAAGMRRQVRMDGAELVLLDDALAEAVAYDGPAMVEVLTDPNLV